MSKMASAVVLHLAKNVRVSSLNHLWQLVGDETFGACEILAELAQGKTIDLTGELSLYPDGRLTVYAPFGWDGPSPRWRVKYRGRTLCTVGTPMGPYMKGTRLRATARGSLVHDRLGRSVRALAAASGLSVEQVYAIADRRLRKDVSEDWSRQWGDTFYRVLRAEAAMGHPYRGGGAAGSGVPAACGEKAARGERE
jgi:hypothetical protein